MQAHVKPENKAESKNSKESTVHSKKRAADEHEAPSQKRARVADLVNNFAREELDLERKNNPNIFCFFSDSIISPIVEDLPPQCNAKKTMPTPTELKM